MENLKELRTRITATQATKKITYAMQMVAASKLRQAQIKAQNARPYGKKMADIVEGLGGLLSRSKMKNPLLLGTKNPKTYLLLVASAERGLCGGFNALIAKKARNAAYVLKAKGKKVKILCVGRKGADLLKREFGEDMLSLISYQGQKNVGLQEAQALSKKILALFQDQAFDVCYLFYARFKNVMTQTPIQTQLIPAFIAPQDALLENGASQGDIPQGISKDKNKRDKDKNKRDEAGVHIKTSEGFCKMGAYEYEPDEKEILDVLIPLYVTTKILTGFLENQASEQGARMTAMDNATRNAGEMIDQLTIHYNRSRQAQITKELIEVISGAEAV